MALEFKDGNITGSSGVAKAGLALGIVGTALGAMNSGWRANGCNGFGYGFNSFGNRGFGSAFGFGNGWGYGLNGTGLGLGYGNNFVYGNNFGYGNDDTYYGSGRSWDSRRGELGQSEIAALDSKIAKLESMRYTDYVGMDLYKNIIATAKEEDAKIAKVQGDMIGYVIDLDKRTALNEQASRLNREYDTAARDYMFTILNNKLDCCCEKTAMQIDFNKQLSSLADASIVSYVNSTFLPGTLKLPITSICPLPAEATTPAAA